MVVRLTADLPAIFGSLTQYRPSKRGQFGQGCKVLRAGTIIQIRHVHEYLRSVLLLLVPDAVE
jgi:hypothetical protein